METITERRDWDFAADGELDGMYVETRSVTIKNGPSAGQTKTVVDFHVGPDDELVTVWPPTVLKRMFREELKRRGKSDFEPGERMLIRPKGKRTGPNGPYWDFENVEFEHAAPKPSAVDLFRNEPQDEDAPALPAGEPATSADDDIPF